MLCFKVITRYFIQVGKDYLVHVMSSVDAARCIQFARSVAYSVKQSNAPWQGSLLGIAFVAFTPPPTLAAARNLIALLLHGLVKPYTFLEIYGHQQCQHAGLQALRMCLICSLGKARFAGLGCRGSNPGGARFSASLQIRPWGPPNLPYNR